VVEQFASDKTGGSADSVGSKVKEVWWGKREGGVEKRRGRQIYEANVKNKPTGKKWNPTSKYGEQKGGGKLDCQRVVRRKGNSIQVR